MKTFLQYTALAFVAFILNPLYNVSAEEEQQTYYSEAELDQMLAPIALYPDVLLAQVLIASTYPLEVVQAARWVEANPDVTNEDRAETLADSGWDPSVQALTAFPDLLQRMSEDLDWTQRMGEAFLLQEGQVVDSIQEFRQRADGAGSLDGMEHVRIEREREIIIIEPADPQVIYVPYYRPAVVYGGWLWPSYPPAYWGPSIGVYSGTSFAFVWSSGWRVPGQFYYSSWDWPQRQILVVNNINNHHYHYHRHSHRGEWNRYGSKRWNHRSAHRRGVSYRNERLNRTYGRSTEARSERRDGTAWRDSRSTRDSRNREDTVRRRIAESRGESRRGQGDRDASERRRPSYRLDSSEQVQRDRGRRSERFRSGASDLSRPTAPDRGRTSRRNTSPDQSREGRGSREAWQSRESRGAAGEVRQSRNRSTPDRGERVRVRRQTPSSPTDSLSRPTIRQQRGNTGQSETRNRSQGRQRSIEAQQRTDRQTNRQGTQPVQRERRTFTRPPQHHSGAEARTPREARGNARTARPARDSGRERSRSNSGSERRQ